MQFRMIINDKIKVSMKEVSFKKLRLNLFFSFFNKINSITTTIKIPKYANNFVSKNKYIDEKKILKISSSPVKFFLIKEFFIRR